MPPQPAKKPDEEKQPAPAPKKRSWRKRLLVLSVVLFALLALINGPIARRAIHSTLENAFHSIGMQGELEVEGTVLSGIAISDLTFTGDQGIEQISLGSLSLNYEIRELFDGKIRGIDLEKFHIVIDSAKFPESETTEEDTTAQVRQTLAELRPYLTSSHISLKHLEVTLLKNEKLTAHFTLNELSHTAGSGTYQLSGFTATDAEEQSTPDQNITLNWQPESASVTRLELLPDIALEKINLDWKNSPEGEASILIDDAEIAAKLANTTSLRLIKGKIRSDFLNHKFSLDLPLDFVISAANAKIENWHQPVPRWKIIGNLGLASLDYDAVSLRNTKLGITQKKSQYTLNLTTNSNDVKLKSTASGKWQDPDGSEWWSNTSLNYDVDATAYSTPAIIKKQLPDNLPLNLTNTSLKLSGVVSLRDAKLTHANTTGNISGLKIDQSPIPETKIRASYKPDTPITARLNISEQIQLSGGYDLKQKNYRGKLSVNTPEPKWINQLLTSFGQSIQLTGPTTLTWQGSGSSDLDKPQTGKANITRLALSSKETETIALTGKTDYAWPNSVSVSNLTATQADWSATVNASWDGKTISLTGVELLEKAKPIASIRGTAPFASKVGDLNSFFAQADAWDITIKSKPISITQLETWLGMELIKGLTGKAAADLEIGGSPASPSIQGVAKLIEINGLDPSQKAPVSATVNLRSEGKKLRVNTEVKEGDTPLLSSKLTLPFEPNKLINNPENAEQWIDSAKLEGTANMKTLPLERLQRFVPQLEKIQGTVSGNATLSGTLTKPRYSVDLTAKAPVIRLRESEIGDIREVELTATVTDEQKFNTRLTAKINGGKFEVDGQGSIADLTNPTFDFKITAGHALVHRDDLISVRANTNLNVSGTIKEATVTGEIGIVESLIYKDMELIPIGVPSSEVAKVKLPALNAEKADNLPVPAPFSDWKLDLSVATQDPILVRGNVASGHIQGSIRVGGTLANPKPDGTLIAKDIKAKLPFSILNVPRGEINFKPDGGLIPTLSIRGKSTVGGYDVSVFVYGSASSPKTTLTSYPPLPESEIMSLLGTGTTTAGLEDRDVASFKAFQLFLMKLKKRNEKPGGNKLFKQLLEGVDNLNLNVGEKDRFTGRKYSSATIEVSPKWHLTAQVDAENQTRGLIVYVIRFR